MIIMLYKTVEGAPRSRNLSARSSMSLNSFTILLVSTPSGVSNSTAGIIKFYGGNYQVWCHLILTTSSKRSLMRWKKAFRLTSRSSTRSLSKESPTSDMSVYNCRNHEVLLDVEEGSDKQGISLSCLRPTCLGYGDDRARGVNSLIK